MVTIFSAYSQTNYFEIQINRIIFGSKPWLNVYFSYLIMSPLEKVKNRVPIQNMLTFCHVTLSIEKSTKIEYTMWQQKMRSLIYKMKVDFWRTTFSSGLNHIYSEKFPRFSICQKMLYENVSSIVTHNRVETNLSHMRNSLIPKSFLRIYALIPKSWAILSDMDWSLSGKWCCDGELYSNGVI